MPTWSHVGALISHAAISGLTVTPVSYVSDAGEALATVVPVLLNSNVPAAAAVRASTLNFADPANRALRAEQWCASQKRLKSGTAPIATRRDGRVCPRASARRAGRVTVLR